MIHHSEKLWDSEMPSIEGRFWKKLPKFAPQIHSSESLVFFSLKATGTRENYQVRPEGMIGMPTKMKRMILS